MKKKNLILSLLTLALLVFGIFIGVELLRENQDLRDRAAVDEIDISLSPADISIAPGSAITLDLFAHQNLLEFAAATIDLSFDPSIVDYVSFETAPGLVLLSQDFTASTLIASFGVECYPDNTCFTSIDPVIKLATLHFTALNPGDTIIEINPSTAKSAAKEAFAYDRTGLLTSASINVSANPTPMPTATPTPTGNPNLPTPSPTPPAPTPPAEPQLGTVYGLVTVSDSTHPIEGATVTLRIPGINGAPGLVQEVTTDNTGRYDIVDEPGVYDIQYTAKNFKGLASQVTLREAQTYRKDIELEPKNKNFLDSLLP